MVFDVKTVMVFDVTSQESLHCDKRQWTAIRAQAQEGKSSRNVLLDTARLGPMSRVVSRTEAPPSHCQGANATHALQTSRCRHLIRALFCIRCMVHTRELETIKRASEGEGELKGQTENESGRSRETPLAKFCWHSGQCI